MSDYAIPTGAGRDLLGCVCLSGDSCAWNCRTTLTGSQLMPRDDDDDVRVITHRIKRSDPTQPIDLAVYDYIEDHVDGVLGDVLRVEAWSDGSCEFGYSF